MKKITIVFLTLVCTQLLLDKALASDRIALVIGNASYQESPLSNPINDARAMSKQLERFDFEVIQAIDADLSTMQQAVLDFMKRVNTESTALVFYAGHGIQANGRNYLLPIDATLKSERALRFEALELGDILEELEETEARINIVILDACRNNPFERRFRGGARGLAVVDAAQGTLIAYATAPGSVASDGLGENGLYTQELLKALDQPGLKVEEVFKSVRRQVSEASGGEQIPWESSSLVGDFVFNTAPIAKLTPAIANQTQAAYPRPEKEMLFWQSIENSQDQADFKDYLDQYPSGTFSGIASRRIALLDTPDSPGCDDLTGRWYASLVDAEENSCRDTFTVRHGKKSEYDIDYAVCGALDSVTNIRGKGTFVDNTLNFSWRSMPCSGTTEYELDNQCRTGTGRVVKRGGLPGVCNLFVNKNLVVNVEREESTTQ